MKVVVFRKGLQGVRQIDLASPVYIASALAVVAFLFVTGFSAGSFLSQRNANGADLAEVRELRNQLNQSLTAIESTRRESEDTLDALAIRLGRMNAHVIRLDALGQRLTEMAKLEDGEFDFGTDPAIGGPLEPEFVSGGQVADVHESLDLLAGQLSDREKQLNVLETMLLNQHLSQRTYPEGRPVKSGWLSSYFGKRTDPFTGKTAWHKGVDFAGKDGDDIIAVAAGVVTYSGDRYGYGRMVEIDHGKGYVTRYAHNRENLVEVGEEVARGQVIGLMGQTGRATGPNLHFEVLLKGKGVDPVKFINAGSRKK